MTYEVPFNNLPFSFREEFMIQWAKFPFSDNYGNFILKVMGVKNAIYHDSSGSFDHDSISFNSEYEYTLFLLRYEH